MDSETKKGEGFVMKEGSQAHDGVDFATFIFSLATGAFIQMGEVPDPATGKKEKNLLMAKQNIDLLLLMREKTKGNLSTEENRMLEDYLNEAQLKFVEVSARDKKK